MLAVLPAVQLQYQVELGSKVCLPLLTATKQGSDGGGYNLPLYQWHLTGTHWCLVDECMFTVGIPLEVLQSISMEVGRRAEMWGAQQLRAVKGARNSVGVGVAHKRGCVRVCVHVCTSM